MDIQWYPGHMTKAKRMLMENLKLIDVVVELIDARAPISTRNPDFDSLFAGKYRVVILNKADLADKRETKRWIAHYENKGIVAIDITATNAGKRKAVIDAINRAAREKIERMRQKGVIKTVRAMIVGIPNVGKSTLINTISGASRALVGDKPGVTRGKQWVSITPQLELMDTPGLLWPRIENQIYAAHLAYLGSINDEIIDTEALATGLLSEMMTICPDMIIERYKCITRETERNDLLEAVAKSRGFIQSGGMPDILRAARMTLNEFRAGKTARVTLETPEAL
ncbi:MAG: ribosome biogenesis GTPase YlqF [Clostridia bacterium]